jgi:O-antigen/teichoic acid export membrane protein
VNRATVHLSRARRRVAGVRRQAVTWGFASQAACSATNFGLSLLAGRALGPAGLGAVFVGFAYYQAVLGFQRSLVAEPLVSLTSALEPDQREQATRAALTMLSLWACAATFVLGLAGLLLPDPAGDGLLLFLPWLVPALVQDFWRVVLFREHRGAASALNDTVWLATMVIAVPLAFAFRAAWAVMASWGLGALAGMILGRFQTRLRPAPLKPALRWWRAEAWPLGRWLGAGGVVYIVGSHGLVLLLAFILDAEALGGLRAVESVFAPLSLLGPALALPGLPALSRKVASSVREAKRAATRLGVGAALATGMYLAITAVNRGSILSVVFGGSFEGFGQLVWPIGLRQMLTALTIGFNLLLMAQQRGRLLLLSQILSTAAMLSLGLWLAERHGVIGAAWGGALAAGVQGLVMAVAALRWSAPRRPDEVVTTSRS